MTSNSAAEGRGAGDEPLVVLLPGDPRLSPAIGDIDALLALVSTARLDPSADAWPAQSPTRARFEELAARGAAVLDRSPSPAHFTASSLVVESGAERVAVLWHNKARRWLQPGGHADGDGNLAHVAWREATEETGIAGLAVVVPAIHVDVHPFTPPDEPPHLHYDLRFVVLAPPGASPRANHESAEVRWVDPASLGDLDPDRGLVHLSVWGLEIARSLPPEVWPDPEDGRR